QRLGNLNRNVSALRGEDRGRITPQVLPRSSFGHRQAETSGERKCLCAPFVNRSSVADRARPEPEQIEKREKRCDVTTLRERPRYCVATPFAQARVPRDVFQACWILRQRGHTRPSDADRGGDVVTGRIR